MKKATKLILDYKKYIKKIYLVGAVLVFSIGGSIAYIGNSVENPLLILIGFGGLAGGFMIFRVWRRAGDIRYTSKKKDAEAESGDPPNTLYIKLNDIEFLYVENPIGQSQKCYNDSRYYHVQGDLVGEPAEFRLPDDDEKERYYDPSEFANPVTMPSNLRYFSWSASTMQKISVAAMGVIIAAEIIGIVAMG